MGTIAVSTQAVPIAPGDWRTGTAEDLSERHSLRFGNAHAKPVLRLLLPEVRLVTGP